MDLGEWRQRERRAATDANECAEIILVEGEPAGMLKIARDGKNWYLIQIQVVPQLQGAGLGSRLLRELVEEARSAGASLGLDVLKVNVARRLYERLGFVIVGESEHSFEMRLASDVKHRATRVWPARCRAGPHC